MLRWAISLVLSCSLRNRRLGKNVWPSVLSCPRDSGADARFRKGSPGRSLSAAWTEWGQPGNVGGPAGGMRPASPSVEFWGHLGVLLCHSWNPVPCCHPFLLCPKCLIHPVFSLCGQFSWVYHVCVHSLCACVLNFDFLLTPCLCGGKALILWAPTRDEWLVSLQRNLTCTNGRLCSPADGPQVSQGRCLWTHLCARPTSGPSPPSLWCSVPFCPTPLPLRPPTPRMGTTGTCTVSPGYRGHPANSASPRVSAVSIAFVICKMAYIF